ncbi:MAG: cation diffusion facilitator family transporter [Candidatus Thorarchaeota archaeon]
MVNFRRYLSKYELYNEQRFVLEILNEKPRTFEEIIVSIKPLLMNKWSKWQLGRYIKGIPNRVEKVILYLIEGKLIEEEDNIYHLTDKGRLKVEKTQDRNDYFKWVKPLAHPNISAIIFFSGYVILWWLKIEGYIFTDNLILLADSFSSSFGVLTIIVISVAPKIRYDKIIIICIQIIFILTGIPFLLIGVSRILEPLEGSTLNVVFPIICVLIIIGLCLFVYFHLGESVNDDAVISVYKKKIQGDILIPAIVLLPIIAESFGIFFFEGLIILSYGIIIMGEAIRINIGRYTGHVLIFLNERPHSYQEIVEIDNRIAMLFGAPMFMYGHDPASIWWQDKGLRYLENKGYIEKKDEVYSITEKGKQPADDDSKKMIGFIRFVKSLTRPVISPILSLVFHLFLGSVKIIGYMLTGSVGLLGDGLDSAIDGVSSIVVGIAMRIRKETQVTYLLIFLMLITGSTIIFASISRILNPIALDEELLAMMIAVFSIFLCFLLYLYQRYSGYINQSLAILAQSEDSKNHVLNAFLVLIAVSASYYKIYFLDGLVGCFIGIIILQGAYDVFKDLRSMSQGESVDFEKYKLGFWKGFSKFRFHMFKNWILYQILNGITGLATLETAFDNVFHPITIHHSQREDLTINYSYNKESLIFSINELLEEGLIRKKDIASYTLTDEGRIQIEKAIKRHKRH